MELQEKMEAIIDACTLGNINMVETIIKRCSNQREIDVLLGTARDIQGYNCFEIAYLKKNYSLLEYLKSQLSKFYVCGFLLFRNIQLTPSNNDYDMDGFFGDIARLSDDIALPIVQQFLADGFDVNSIDNSLTTLLHCACVGRQYNVVKFLIDNGADVNATDCYFMQPLHLLCEDAPQDKEIFTKIANLLLEHGAMLNFTNAMNKTPFDILDNEYRTILLNLTLKTHRKEMAKQAAMYEEKIKELQTITPNMQKLFVYLALESKNRV